MALFISFLIIFSLFLLIFYDIYIPKKWSNIEIEKCEIKHSNISRSLISSIDSLTN
jgi:hypothetical protein